MGSKLVIVVVCKNTCVCMCVEMLVLMASLQVLELVYSSLGVALADLPQGLVLVSSLPHILLVDLVHGRLLLGVSRGLKVML